MKGKALLYWAFCLAGVCLVAYSLLKLFGERTVSPWVGFGGLILTIVGLCGVYLVFSVTSQVFAGIGCGLGILGSFLLLIPAASGSVLPFWAELVYCVGFVLLGWMQYRRTNPSKWAGIGMILGAVGIIVFTLLVAKTWVSLSGLILGFCFCITAFDFLSGAGQKSWWSFARGNHT